MKKGQSRIGKEVGVIKTVRIPGELLARVEKLKKPFSEVIREALEKLLGPLKVERLRETAVPGEKPKIPEYPADGSVGPNGGFVWGSSEHAVNCTCTGCAGYRKGVGKRTAV